ncbi:MAG: HD domain-containing protein, partial [Lachnospiraceae bacterium]|nr:HD domain-containing protein [Lachnospiraceae bacterium]
LTVLSEALDCVEKEILGTASYHAKRVAWLCLRMAKELGWSDGDLSELVISALLHDSALNEYRDDYENGVLRTGITGRNHCTAGEKNLSMIPGITESSGYALYHHERPDGLGPFGKTEAETPMGAQLIHIADQTDRVIPLGNISTADLSRIEEYIEEMKGKLFGERICGVFLGILSEEMVSALSDEQMETWVPDIPDKFCDVDSRLLAGLFARIIDYKSPFTKDHSVGLAEKAEAMAHYYHWGKDMEEQLYFAGALHDIGKLMVSLDVLEKPGRLDKEEYQHIQTHAYETWSLLSRISGLEKITEWASYHHEKLNGKGYPFGKTADSLDEKARLLACLDIYQALTEDRPYKAGMNHTRAMGILKELVEKGELDGQITKDIDSVFHREEKEAGMVNTALFQCPVCGYIYEGDMLPQEYICPVCGQPETAFVRMK